MNSLWPGKRVTETFERIILATTQLLLMGIIALALLDLVYLLAIGVTTKLWALDSVGELQVALQRGFAGVLLLLIGLELLATLRAYLYDHNFRLEVVLVVALIAISRHVIQIDIGHANGLTLIGIAALTLALVVGYFVVRRVALEAGHTAPEVTAASPPEDIPQ